jgi:hypothetical protein
MNVSFTTMNETKRVNNEEEVRLELGLRLV